MFPSDCFFSFFFFFLTRRGSAPSVADISKWCGPGRVLVAANSFVRYG